jgi:hypothetical protein
LGVALLGDCAEQLGQKPEILKRIDETLLMVAQEEEARGEALLKNRLLKSARERLQASRTGSGGCTAIGKFGELGRNREEAVTLTG